MFCIFLYLYRMMYFYGLLVYPNDWRQYDSSMKSFSRASWMILDIAILTESGGWLGVFLNLFSTYSCFWIELEFLCLFSSAVSYMFSCFGFQICYFSLAFFCLACYRCSEWSREFFFLLDINVILIMSINWILYWIK